MSQTAQRNSAGVTHLPLDLDGVTRPQHHYLPSTPAPLLLFLHGIKSSTYGQRTKAKMCYLGAQVTKSERDHQVQESQDGYP